ncbi:hypothetical protein F1D05_22525 [Kribbella qitaiheensis]|uniref:HEAT repeat domain-containing protein n=1 Tax=Kribbella qitaiheensis TaxID=1544730 RepID=A0A7G6X1R2_9ACTN|nr:hypothetical protein [Kribbella qitaiheensis]QNE20177.1 hypothetical protein F1D05_22525 [Kribbella qitaiheensis]
MSDESWGDLRARCVVPFYQHMMGINALEAAPSVLAEVAALVDTVEPDQVVYLLRSGWREQVIGAWLSLAHPYDESVLAAVRHALETSNGSLTAPCLLAVLVASDAPTAISLIQGYYEADVARSWGSAGLAQAAAATLPDSPLPAPAADDTETFMALSMIANCLKPATDQTAANSDS